MLGKGTLLGMQVLKLLGEAAVVFMGHTQPTDNSASCPRRDPEASMCSTRTLNVLPWFTPRRIVYAQIAHSAHVVANKV